MKHLSSLHKEDGGPLRPFVISGKKDRGFGAVDRDRPRTSRWTFVPFLYRQTGRGAFLAFLSSYGINKLRSINTR
jgi:hypothetical protein